MKSTFRAVLSLGCLLVLTCSAPSQVIISEFMADNKHTLADEDGQFPDWVELYNTNRSTVNRSGSMQFILITDPIAPGSAARFYRIVTPWFRRRSWSTHRSSRPGRLPC